MFKFNQANFFKTEDNEQLFYLTNFSQIDDNKMTLVFNYGLVCSNHHWKYQVDYFDEKGYQILLHDYRGHFQSSGSKDIKKITFPQMAKDLKDICDFLGIKKTYMLGHSMGVNITLQMAKDFPDLIQGMVLISGTFMAVNDVMFDSNVMEFITPYCVAGLEKYPDVFKKLWTSTGMNPLIKNIIHSTGFNKAMVSKDFIEIYLNRVGQLGPDVFFQLFTEMTKVNITPSLESMNMPSLVIGGLKDNVIPNHLQRTLASLLPNSETYFLPTGSHVPQADFPALMNERMDLFLAK
jgi:pimeloyl-ACP methyl ester carboxylesterase